MRLRSVLAVLLLLSVRVPARATEKETAAAKKRPFSLVVSPSVDGLPLITLTASEEPLGRVGQRLAKELGTTVEVSAQARDLPVTADFDQRALDLTLRRLAPQTDVDAVLSGGPGKVQIRAIYLSTAGEPAPSLEKLRQRKSDMVMFYGNTEDQGADPFDGKLEVTYRNERLRVFARSQPLVVVVARIADALGIPVELIGDSPEVVDVSIAEGTLEEVMRALTPSAKLYYRVDLTALRMTPVRLVVEAPLGPARPDP